MKIKIWLITGISSGLGNIQRSQAIFDITQLDTPPLRLPLGKIAIESLTTKLDSVQRDITNYKDIAERVVL